jgi:hypothetical protein
MAGLIIDHAYFYKSSGPRLKVGDAGVAIGFDAAQVGFEIRVSRGKVLSIPEGPFDRPPISKQRAKGYIYLTRQKAENAFKRLRETLERDGFRRMR